MRTQSKSNQPKKTSSIQIITGVLFLILLLVGLIAGYYLTQTQQEIRQQAALPSECLYGSGCPAGWERASNCDSCHAYETCCRFKEEPTATPIPCAYVECNTAETGCVYNGCDAAGVPGCTLPSCDGRCGVIHCPHCKNEFICQCSPTPEYISPTPTTKKDKTPTPTPSLPTYTITPTQTPTAGPSPTPTLTPTAGPSPTPTKGPSPTPTKGPSPTPTPTQTKTLSPTPTNTPIPSSTPTLTPTLRPDQPTYTPTPTLRPGQPTYTPAPTLTPVVITKQVITTIQCNSICQSNEECYQIGLICYNNRCRLAANPESPTCEMPQDTPVTGPENWLNYLKIGLGILGIGALLFLLI